MENRLVLMLCTPLGFSIISTRSTRVLILTSGRGVLLLLCIFPCDLFHLDCLSKKTTDVCFLVGDAAQGTDPFDLVIEAIWLGCTEFLNQEQLFDHAK